MKALSAISFLALELGSVLYVSAASLAIVFAASASVLATLAAVFAASSSGLASAIACNSFAFC
ncbi:hypothetical protein ACFLY2_00935 [Patescibacteria group bacterium]